MGNTVTLHRILKTTPEKLYRAFLEPDALVRWMPPNGFIAKIQNMDPHVGGGYKMSFVNFGTGTEHSFDGKYVELKPNELIKYTNQFNDGNLPGQMQVTVSIKKVMCGVDLKIVQEGVPEAIPVEMCYLGWQDSLKMLARLVEPEIPDQG